MQDRELCSLHLIPRGEGDICWKCEAAADHARDLLIVEMSQHEYQLWFVCSKQVLYKCPVANFDEAKLLFHTLDHHTTVGVRIARYDPTEGCESVLFKFN